MVDLERSESETATRLVPSHLGRGKGISSLWCIYAMEGRDKAYLWSGCSRAALRAINPCTDSLITHQQLITPIRVLQLPHLVNPFNTYLTTLASLLHLPLIYPSIGSWNLVRLCLYIYIYVYIYTYMPHHGL